MLDNIPKNILKYLIDELPPYTGLLILKTDSDGNILKHYGPHNEYLAQPPEIDKPSHEIVPSLYGMIPPLVSPMVLQNIKSSTGVYTDIHIVDSEDDCYYIFFVNQNHVVDGIKDVLQKINEEKLLNETNQKTTVFSSDLFSIFDYLILELKDSDTAKIINNIPNWFTKLKPEINKNEVITFTEAFPFLEVFIIEAQAFWDENKDGKYRSGIWTETSIDTNEIMLQAYAAMKDEKRYLIIQPYDEEFDHKSLAFQMAREQKLAYEKLEKTEKKLKTLLEYKDKFVSIVSHDLRSPVSAVLGIADILINDNEEMAKLSEFYKDLIFNIKDEMHRMLDYNAKLYHWSNLELGNFEVVKKPIELIKIIKTTFRTAETKVKEKNIELSTNLKDDLIVDIDQTLFLQVMNNLLSNAIKFTPENGKISIDVFDKNDHFEIWVTDNGVGMPNDIAKNIFAGFSRKSTLGTKGEKGTGLGMGIVQKIIEAHEFSIRVESEVGKGTSFIISI